MYFPHKNSKLHELFSHKPYQGGIVQSSEYRVQCSEFEVQNIRTATSNNSELRWRSRRIWVITRNELWY
jgi:hypothetical protein